MMTKDEIESCFGFHKATIEGANATLPTHKQMRMNYKIFAETLDKMIPDGREKALAMTALEEASMWSHKAVSKLAPLEEEA